MPQLRPKPFAAHEKIREKRKRVHENEIELGVEVVMVVVKAVVMDLDMMV